MKQTLKPFTLLFLLGLAFAVPVLQGCVASSVAPNPAPLEQEAEEEGKNG